MILPIIVTIGALSQIYADRNLDFRGQYIYPLCVAALFWIIHYSLQRVK